MPNVTLRLSDEQHAELSAAAEREHRSLQKEIVHRLFAPSWERYVLDTANAADAHFKPDPKPTTEKKGRR